MSTVSTPSAGISAAAPGPRILVWDLPTRIFHWSLAGSFAIAWLTGDSERWRDVHLVAGYSMLALIAFRLVWEIVGSRYARFSAFLRGPAAIGRYLRSLLRGDPEHHVGHNPAGALAILGLLTLGLLTGLTGWAIYNELWNEEVLEELHEGLATAMLGLVFLHLAGVAVSSLIHRENLARAMVNGRKQGAAVDAIARPRRLAALLLTAGLAGIWGVGLLASPARLPGLDLAADSREVNAAGAARERASEDERERDQRDDRD